MIVIRQAARHIGAEKILIDIANRTDARQQHRGAPGRGEETALAELRTARRVGSRTVQRGRSSMRGGAATAGRLPDRIACVSAGRNATSAGMVNSRRLTPHSHDAGQ